MVSSVFLRRWRSWLFEGFLEINIMTHFRVISVAFASIACSLAGEAARASLAWTIILCRETCVLVLSGLGLHVPPLSLAGDKVTLWVSLTLRQLYRFGDFLEQTHNVIHQRSEHTLATSVSSEISSLYHSTGTHHWRCRSVWSSDTQCTVAAAQAQVFFVSQVSATRWAGHGFQWAPAKTTQPFSIILGATGH